MEGKLVKPCGVGARHHGRDSAQLALIADACTCRSYEPCWWCGSPHLFVARCQACAATGRRGVPYEEIPR